MDLPCQVVFCIQAPAGAARVSGIAIEEAGEYLVVVAPASVQARGIKIACPTDTGSLLEGCVLKLAKTNVKLVDHPPKSVIQFGATMDMTEISETWMAMGSPFESAEEAPLPVVTPVGSATPRVDPTDAPAATRKHGRGSSTKLGWEVPQHSRGSTTKSGWDAPPLSSGLGLSSGLSREEAAKLRKLRSLWKGGGVEDSGEEQGSDSSGSEVGGQVGREPIGQVPRMPTEGGSPAGDSMVLTEVMKLLGVALQGKAKVGTRSESESSEGGHNRFMRKYRGLRRLRRRNFAKWHTVWKEYRARVMAELGVHGDQPFRLRDYTKKCGFGRMKGLYRIHAFLGDVIEMLDQKDYGAAMVMCIQLCKAIHQTYLDDGEWRSSVLLVPADDPLQRPHFGGEEAEVEIIASYTKARDDLMKAHRAEFVHWEPRHPSVEAGGGDAAASETVAAKSPKKKGAKGWGKDGQ